MLTELGLIEQRPGKNHDKPSSHNQPTLRVNQWNKLVLESGYRKAPRNEANYENEKGNEMERGKSAVSITDRCDEQTTQYAG